MSNQTVPATAEGMPKTPERLALEAKVMARFEAMSERAQRNTIWLLRVRDTLGEMGNGKRKTAR